MTTERLITALNELLSERRNVIEICRELVSMREHFPDADDPDLLMIVGIESETDNFPLGKQRAHWSPEVLAKKNDEIDKYVAEIIRPLREACARLRDRIERS